MSDALERVFDFIIESIALFIVIPIVIAAEHVVYYCKGYRKYRMNEECASKYDGKICQVRVVDKGYAISKTKTCGVLKLSNSNLLFYPTFTSPVPYFIGFYYSDKLSGRCYGYFNTEKFNDYRIWVKEIKS